MMPTHRLDVVRDTLAASLAESVGFETRISGLSYRVE